MLERIEASQQAYDTSRIVVVGLALGSIVLALGLGYVFSWSIVGPLTQIAGAAAPDRGRRVRRAGRCRQPRRAGRARRRRQPHQRGAGQPLPADRGAGAGTQRGPRTADRDQRGPQRHQPLDLRAAAGAGHDRRDRRPALPRGLGAHAQARSRRQVSPGRRQRGPTRIPALRGAKPVVPGRGTIVGRTALEGRTVHVPDLLEDPEFTWFEAQAKGGFEPCSACRSCAGMR